MTNELAASLDWDKVDGLVPAIVQDAVNGRVLMLGYMNPEAVSVTLESGKVSFFSRSRQKLWVKGETSGNHLKLVSMHVDCDQDTLLVLATPQGPTCHTGATTCFDGDTPTENGLSFLSTLEQKIERRLADKPETSYVTSLAAMGTQRIAQKVGEEGVETALAGVVGNDEELLNESADLLFHLLVLLKIREISLISVVKTLEKRDK